MAQKKSTPQQENKPQKSQLVTYFIIFVFGFLAGIAFTVYKGGTTSSTVAEGQSQQQSTETEQAILHLEAR